MQTFTEEHDIMTMPRHALISSYKGEILRGTSLLKFYLKEGLLLTCMHQAVQWRSYPWLEPFGDLVSTPQHAANTVPNQKILGETTKLKGNAGFGQFLMNVLSTKKMRGGPHMPSTVSSFLI